MKSIAARYLLLVLLLVWGVGEAFVPTTLPRRPRLAPLLQGTLGHGDFSKIFGPQEADERRIRELASEYRPPPKQQQQEEETAAAAATNTTKAVRPKTNSKPNKK